MKSLSRQFTNDDVPMTELIFNKMVYQRTGVLTKLSNMATVRCVCVCVCVCARVRVCVYGGSVYMCMCVHVVSVPQDGIGVATVTNSVIISSCQYFNAMRESPLSTNILLECSRGCSTTHHLTIKHSHYHKSTGGWERS